MPTQDYKTKDGKRVPGVTTVIGRRREAEGLIYWAWDCGRQGIDYREARDAAASAGTIAHAMVEAHVRGEPFDRSKHPADLLAGADSAFRAYLDWREQSRLEPVAVELSLVSEAHRFGGTMDMVLRKGDVLYVGDVKTSNSLYYDHLVQVAAYALLWEEYHPDQPIRGYHILRFAKSHADFAHHYFAELDTARRMFLNMRQQYDMISELKKRAA
ncbi:MAG: PD-(D/E)XK nuclease family protein [Bradyrhizobium sp.]|uniref:PD-(D/E)XK nuclease family protein n=1 Tax=Bradyrhizobium sp. TaxID=376 RepID=UPI003D152141